MSCWAGQSLPPLNWDWMRDHLELAAGCQGNGNPLQYSCLENSVDWGAWWAAVHGVTQSRTWLKQLSNSRQYQAACKPTDLSETSLQGVVVIQVNQLAISVRLSDKIPRQVMLLHLALLSRWQTHWQSSLMGKEGIFLCYWIAPSLCTQPLDDQNGLGTSGLRLCTWWHV